jgi:diacylglycerol kinase
VGAPVSGDGRRPQPVIPNHPESGKRSATRVDSFRHAFSGWAALIRRTPNARIHLAFALGAVALAAWLGLSLTGWAILWLTIGLVVSAEFLNSAIEAAVDLASPELHPVAKAAKDMAAGAVLFAACIAVIIGLLILGPPLLSRLTAIFPTH